MLSILRDRHGEFEVQLIKKYCRRFLGFDRQVFSLYALGTGTTQDPPGSRSVAGHDADDNSKSP